MLVNVPKAMGKYMLLGKNIDVNLARSAYEKRHAFIWKIQDEAAKKCGAVILDPMPHLCDNTHCYGSINGVPLYSDDDHLNEFGNKRLKPMFSEVFTGRIR